MDEDEKIVTELFFSELEKRFYKFAKDSYRDDAVDWGDDDEVDAVLRAFFKDLSGRYARWLLCRAEHKHG